MDESANSDIKGRNEKYNYPHPRSHRFVSCMQLLEALRLSVAKLR